MKNCNSNIFEGLDCSKCKWKDSLVILWIVLFVQDPDADTEAGGKMSSKEGAGPPQDVEEWNLLVKQLEDVLTLKNLLNLGKKNNITEVTVSKILEGGRGG